MIKKSYKKFTSFVNDTVGNVTAYKFRLIMGIGGIIEATPAPHTNN
jgi:hypothetical protein